jgi:hypothetical protein
MKSILISFPITGEEYSLLMDKFDKYCYYIAWQLKKNNTRNNSTDELEDIIQQLRFAVVKAAAYYKRQTYIESSLKVLGSKIGDKFTAKLLKVLEKLWVDRTRHGANRQKFGDYQEIILDQLLKKYVPKKNRPSKDAVLVLDVKFATYCKQICWNEQRALGKKITREKSLRVGMTSLSSYDYLGGE